MIDSSSKEDFMDLLSLNDDTEEKSAEKEDKLDLETLEDMSQEDIQKLSILELIKTIGFNNEVLNEVKDAVMVGGDAEFADAYSKIAKANVEAIKVISEFALQKERLKTQKELKDRDIEGKKEINEHKQGLIDGSPNNNSNSSNLLGMSRDEIFNRLFNKEIEDKPSKKKINKNS